MKKVSIIMLSILALTLFGGCKSSAPEAPKSDAEKEAKQEVANTEKTGETAETANADDNANRPESDNAKTSAPTKEDDSAGANEVQGSAPEFVDPSGFDIMLQGKKVRARIVSTFHDEDPKYKKMCEDPEEPCSILLFEDSTIPSYIVGDTRGMSIINLGDLDDDGSDEIAAMPDFRPLMLGDYRRSYFIESLKQTEGKSEWIQLLPPLDTDNRTSLYWPVEKIAAKPGWIVVRYIDVENDLDKVFDQSNVDNPEIKMFTKEIELPKGLESDIKSKMF